MSAAVQPAMTPASIRETIMYMFTRNARLDDPVLSDETAFMIMGILDDLWLWFDSVYGEQARSYRPPETVDPDDDPPDDPLDPF
ncbi:hypothetical protein PQR34_46840 [Paraburkholderia sediminicola]|jgi:hypothetical protein|uniref:hypothetical protein n=1 Tax=Paraburkholderia sediminicola TaxID=458836 RepID=UPI0038BBD951